MRIGLWQRICRWMAGMGDALAGIAGWHEMGLPPWEAGVFAPGATLEREEARYLAGLACLKQHRQTNDRAAAREQ